MSRQSFQDVGARPANHTADLLAEPVQARAPTVGLHATHDRSTLCPPRLDRRRGHVLPLPKSTGRRRLDRRRRPDLLQWSTRASQHASQPDTAWARRAATGWYATRSYRRARSAVQVRRYTLAGHSGPSASALNAKGGRLRSRSDFGARLGRRAAKVHNGRLRPQRCAASRPPRQPPFRADRLAPTATPPRFRATSPTQAMPSTTTPR
jgi:hypothetical protein